MHMHIIKYYSISAPQLKQMRVENYVFAQMWQHHRLTYELRVVLHFEGRERSAAIRDTCQCVYLRILCGRISNFGKIISSTAHFIIYSTLAN